MVYQQNVLWPDEPYLRWNNADLRKILEGRKLPRSGTKARKVARLRAYDQAQ